MDPSPPDAGARAIAAMMVAVATRPLHVSGGYLARDGLLPRSHK